MKHVDMSNVKEAGQFETLPAGKYIGVIRKVEDFPDKEYLKVTYDIAEGEHAGHFDKIREAHPDYSWIGAYVKSYKPKALPMFKRFCSAVSKSNGAFVFDGGTVNADEQTLVGKKYGIVLREEEYYSNSGDLRTRLIVDQECPIDKLDSMKVRPVKKIQEDGQDQAQTAPAPAAAPASDEFMNIPEGAGEEVPF